jgi:hypothetical protein
VFFRLAGTPRGGLGLPSSPPAPVGARWTFTNPATALKVRTQLTLPRRFACAVAATIGSMPTR